MRGKVVRIRILSNFVADGIVVYDDMPQPQRRAGSSAIAAAADAVLQLAVRETRIRLPLLCGRHAATARLACWLAASC